MNACVLYDIDEQHDEKNNEINHPSGRSEPLLCTSIRDGSWGIIDMRTGNYAWSILNKEKMLTAV